MLFDTFEDSEFHSKATPKLDSLNQWYLPSIVFHELVWFFRARRVQIGRARLKVQEYLSNEKTEFSACAADDIEFAVSQMKSYEDYNDLLILSSAKRLGQPLFTFDGELRRQARRHRVRLVE